MVLAAMVTVMGCGKKGPEQNKNIKIGIVLSIGGLGDKSFNDSAYRGLEMAKEKLGIEFNYVEPASTAEDEQYLTQYAEDGYDLVIGTGFLMKDAVEKVANKYPDIKFVIIDEVIDLPNVASLTFKEHEGSFLVGALAAMMSESNKIGFVGGMEIPLIKKFQYGFEQGIHYVDPSIEVSALYTTSSNPFNDPVQGKNNALNLIGQGADVVYHAAGATGLGVIEACKEKAVWAIGVDSDQDDVEPGVVLTSMMKKVDNAVYAVSEEVAHGKFKSGVRELGVKEGGVGTTEFTYTKDKIGPDKLKKLEEIQADIVSGKITVESVKK